MTKACARFMGWKIITSPARQGGHDIELIEYIGITDGRCKGLVANYHPDEDTSRGREQANEIWKELKGRGYYVQVSTGQYNADRAYANISSQAGVLWPGEGDWWNSALVSAVAKLQMRIESEVSYDS